MWNQQGGGYGDSYGDQGGGYLNTSSQQTSTQNQKSRQRSENIIPCTVAQILKAEQVDDKFINDGINLHQVTLVGLIRSAKESSTNLSYEIDDMTGPFLEVRQFVDNDENTPEAEKVALVRENIYVRIHGHVRAFAGKRNVAAFRVVPLTDMNELTSHLLEVIYAHAYWTKGQAMTTPGKGSASHMGNSMMNTTSASSNFSGQVDVGLTAQQQQVLNVIRSCIDEQGLAMAVVCDRLKGMPLKVVRDSVEFLSSEGHIYSTIDDEHYKATDSM